MKQRTFDRVVRWGILSLGLVLMSACAGLRGQHTTTSVVDYLYPSAKKEPIAEQGIPVLSLPMRVGIAFVPERGGSTLTEAKKASFSKKSPRTSGSWILSSRSRLFPPLI